MLRGIPENSECQWSQHKSEKTRYLSVYSQHLQTALTGSNFKNEILIIHSFHFFWTLWLWLQRATNSTSSPPFATRRRNLTEIEAWTSWLMKARGMWLQCASSLDLLPHCHGMTRTCEGHDNGPIVLGLRWAPGRSECLMTPNQGGGCPARGDGPEWKWGNRLLVHNEINSLYEKKKRSSSRTPLMLSHPMHQVHGKLYQSNLSRTANGSDLPES